MKLEWRASLIILPLIFAVSACGKSNSEEEDADGAPKTSIGGTTIGPTGPGGVGPTGPSGIGPTGPSGTSGDTSGCPQYPSRSFYEYQISGSGTGTASTVFRDIVADQKLRVQIEPVSSGQSGGLGYNKMSATVSLLKDGISVNSKSSPTPGTEQKGPNQYKRGIPVGQKNLPSNLDFSAYLGGTSTYSGGPKYSIRISNVQTNRKCDNNCTTSQYYCGYDPMYCYYYSTYGYNWNFNYHDGQYYCCAGTLLEVCQKDHCGVGNLDGLENANWTLKVRVETDSTTCIPQ